MLAADRKTVVVPKIPQMLESSSALKEIFTAVDPFLQRVATRLAAQTTEFEHDIAAHVQYALGAQGKQLRPILVALSGESVGPLRESHEIVAVIIEMVHLATLIHDDVIDEADLRRGRATMASKCGNEISVLLGDCLFAHALKLASDFPTPEICRAVASATNTVCAGEILQSKGRAHFQLQTSYYFKVLAMKTAELFSLSCDLGGFLGQATPEQREALRQYGKALGIAYQLYDDCLDLLGSEKAAGKTLGADLAKGKMTLPLLIVRDKANPAEREQLRQWVQEWNPGHLPEVLNLIKRYDVLRESRAVVQEYLSAAQQALANLPAGNGRTSLFGLTQFLAQQTQALGVF